MSLKLNKSEKSTFARGYRAGLRFAVVEIDKTAGDPDWTIQDIRMMLVDAHNEDACEWDQNVIK